MKTIIDSKYFITVCMVEWYHVLLLREDSSTYGDNENKE